MQVIKYQLFDENETVSRGQVLLYCTVPPFVQYIKMYSCRILDVPSVMVFNLGQDKQRV